MLGLMVSLIAGALWAQYDVNGDETVPDGTYAGLHIREDGDIANIVPGSAIRLTGAISMGTGLQAYDTGFNMTGGSLDFDAHVGVTINSRAYGGTATFNMSGGDFNPGDEFRVSITAPDGNRGAGGDAINFNISGGKMDLDNLNLMSVNGPSGTEQTNPVLNFNMSGGEIDFRGMSLGTKTAVDFGPDASATMTISGGSFHTGSGVRSIVIGELGTFHVHGAGATLIELTKLTTGVDATLKFTVDIGGLTPIQIPSVDALAGTINMETNVALTPGQQFTLLQPGVSGVDYSSLSLDAADISLWQFVSGGDDLVVEYIPEPATLTLLLLAPLAIFARRRRV